jgi:hypothetical protein
LRVERNGATVTEPVWGTAVPVDPGEHTISVTAPGKVPWERTVTLDPSSEEVVMVGPLRDAPPPSSRSREPSEPGARELGKPPFPTRRQLAWGVGGLGLVAFGVGTGFGLRAISKERQSDEHCNGTLCDPEGLDLNDQARHAATVANVAFGLGALGLGVGTYLWLTSDQDRDNQQHEEMPAAQGRWRVIPAAGPGAAGMLLDGTW